MHWKATRVTARTLVYILMWSSAAVAQQAPPPPAAGAKAQPAEDIGWPRQVTKNGATLIYYQPQIDEWRGYKQIKARIAFSLTPAGGKQAMGVADMEANTLVDKDTRTVFFRDIKSTAVRFPGVDPASAPALDKLFRDLIPTTGEPISMDRVLADLDRSKTDTKPVAVKNDPPQIFYATTPAILLIVQGQPVLSPIEKTDLQFVVNTNWDVFFDKSSKHYFLLDAPVWFEAADLKGPWTTVMKLPKDMTKLPAGQNWDSVKANIPPHGGGVVPQIFYSDKPSELILLKGMPVYSKIPKTGLLYVANTDSDLFVDQAEQQYYVLLSGRWFRSKSFNGPWTYAGNDLPKDFAKIPADSPRARVLASVPGTVEASDAVMLAQIPTTAILNRADVEMAAKVAYDGKPDFQPIQGTSLKYAVNTQDKVIQVGNQYYVCYQAVWLVSANPNGPWKVADSIPKEIYNIPPSSPLYNVTYVTQTTTTSTVESSAAAGYLGMMVVGAAVGLTIAYGTGYYYPPYVYFGPGVLYPVYRPWPMTYGAAAVYNPWTGGFAAGHAAYGPYGAVGSAAWYNPATGRYGRAASAQGWYGGRTVASGYNPWTGGYGATAQGHNAYAQWGSSAAVRGNQWVQTGHVTTANGTAAGYRGSNGQGVLYHGANGGTVARGSDGTYAGKDGNVYRKDGNGSWSQYNNGSWNSVDTSAAKQQAQQRAQSARAAHPVDSQTMQNLNQSWQSRERGSSQAQNFRNFRAGGGRFRR